MVRRILGESVRMGLIDHTRYPQWLVGSLVHSFRAQSLRAPVRAFDRQASQTFTI